MPRRRRLTLGVCGAALAAGGSVSAAAGLPGQDFPTFGEVNQPETIKYADPAFDDELLPVELSGYWGLMNQSGRVIALPVFDWTDFGVEGLARATRDGRTGFILGNGDWRFPPSYEYADRFQDGYAVFGRGGRFGYLDKAGDERLPARLDGALRFKEHAAAARVGDRIGYLNTRFDWTVPPRYTAARSYHQGVAAVRYGEPTTSTSETIPAEPAVDAERITDLPDPADVTGEPDAPAGSATTAEDHREASEQAAPGTAGVWGFIDRRGRTVFTDRTRRITALGDFHQNLARFRTDDGWGFLDRRFGVACPPRFEDLRDFTNGVAAARQGGRWGYVNRRFDWVVPPTYESADDFDDTLAMVRRDGLYGYIDRTGREVIRPQFEYAEPFRLDAARVLVNDEVGHGYVKASGFVLFDPRAAKFGLVDITVKERLRSSVDRWQRGNRTLYAPPPRPRVEPPYPPDYLYGEGLHVGPDPWAVEPAKR
ncbi:MAG: WG repeat-containing protein [Planctomycetota bacterium]